ncbi:MAG: hypothetical protein RLZZ546_1650 [Bacteroidota bacterium]|jgi:hypothetical protein
MLYLFFYPCNKMIYVKLLKCGLRNEYLVAIILKKHQTIFQKCADITILSTNSVK